MTAAFVNNEARIDAFTSAPKPAKEPIRRRKRTESRKVTFLKTVTTHSNSVEEYNVHNRWYSPKDYTDFRSEVDRDSKAYRKLHPQGARTLKQIMRVCKRASTRCGGDEQLGSQELSRLLKPRLASLLQKSIEDAPILIGIDRYCVGFLASDKATRRTEIVEALLVTQRCSKESGLVSETVCKKISCPSRLFAQLIGHAVARAA